MTQHRKVWQIGAGSILAGLGLAGCLFLSDRVLGVSGSKDIFVLSSVVGLALLVVGFTRVPAPRNG